MSYRNRQNIPLPPPCYDLQVDFWDRMESLDQRAKDEIADDFDMFFRLVDSVAVYVDSFMSVLPDSFRVSREMVLRMIMLFLLQCHFNLTSDAVIRISHRDIGFQYVLGNLGKGPSHQVSRSTYFEFLAHVLYHEFKTGQNLFVDLVTALNENIATEMGANLHKDVPGYILITRMDSMLIETPAEIRGRVGIAYRTVHMALEYIAMCEGLAKIPENLHHYLDPSDENATIYHNKNNRMEKLTVILRDAEKAEALFKADEKETDVYLCLTRLLSDQGMRNEKGELVPIPNKEVKGSSMQSPDYPSATARTKNHVTHIGETINFGEVCLGGGNSLIHHVSLKPNTYSDPNFLIDYLEQRDPDGPIEVVITDGAYVTPETLAAAVQKGVILIGTSMPGVVPKPLYADFTLTEDGKDVASCPAGKAPIEGSTKCREKDGVIIAKFDREDCQNCKYVDNCPAKEQARAYRLDISQKMIDRAEIYNSYSTEEHAAYARIRNGVESIPSVMRRRYGIDDMHTMRPGLRLAKLYGCVLSYNLIKLAKFRKEKEKLAKQVG